MRKKADIEIDQDFLNDIRDLVDSKAEFILKNIIRDLHPADIAEILDHLDEEERNYVFQILDTEMASDVILELDDASREDILENLDETQISEMIDEMPSDDAANIVQELDTETAQKVLDQVEDEISEDVRELLQYDPDSAGGIMQLEYIYVYDTETVAEAIEEVREHSQKVEKIYDIYVINIQDVLMGVLSAESLLVEPPSRLVSDIMHRDFVAARTDQDQEEVARLFKKFDLVTLPVVTKTGHLVGRITIDDIIDVIEEEASEDVSKMAGSVDEDVTETSSMRISRSRLPWLITALGGELLAAFVLSRFEQSLSALLALAFFVPIIMAMAGNVAIQCSSIVIRGLATGEIRLHDLRRQVLKELRVASINGFCLGTLLAAIVSFWLCDYHIGLVVGTALICVIFFAALNGTLFPLILKKMNVDPALAAGPFVTMTNDTLGVFIYLGIATMFLL